MRKEEEGSSRSRKRKRGKGNRNNNTPPINNNRHYSIPSTPTTTKPSSFLDKVLLIGYYVCVIPNKLNYKHILYADES